MWALIDKTSKKEPQDLAIAGWDLIYLGTETVAFFLLVFLVEKLKIMPSFTRYFSNEQSIQYEKKEIDEDVQAETEASMLAKPEECTLLVSPRK